jgi:hypothetical protein
VENAQKWRLLQAVYDQDREELKFLGATGVISHVLNEMPELVEFLLKTFPLDRDHEKSLNPVLPMKRLTVVFVLLLALTECPKVQRSGAARPRLMISASRKPSVGSLRIQSLWRIGRRLRLGTHRNSFCGTAAFCFMPAIKG